MVDLVIEHKLPTGSMYAIYGNIYHQYTPNVSIYHTWILWDMPGLNCYFQTATARTSTSHVEKRPFPAACLGVRLSGPMELSELPHQSQQFPKQRGVGPHFGASLPQNARSVRWSVRDITKFTLW